MTEQQINVGIKKCAECEQNLRCKECKYPLLINHLKEENKRLTEENKILSLNADTAFQDGLNETQELYADQIRNEVKSEAYKEFVEKAKEKAENAQTWTGIEPVVTVSDLNNLLKEMG